MSSIDVRVLDDKVDGRSDIKIAIDGVEIIDEVGIGWERQALI